MDFGIKITIVNILLSIYYLSIISGINIDCNGRAFHCVNSTHFKICADLGGGVSKTVDDFLLPCPYNTYCRETNEYECEYYETTTPLTVIAGELSVINDLVEPSVIPLSHTAQMLQVKSFTNDLTSLQNHASEHEDIFAPDILVTSTPYINDNQEINNIKMTNLSTTQLTENANTQDSINQTVFEPNMLQNEIKIKDEDSHSTPKSNELKTSTATIDYVTNLAKKEDLDSVTTENYDIISATFTNGINDTIKIKSKLSINETVEIKTVGSDTVNTTQTNIKYDDKQLFQNTTEEFLPNEDHLKSLTTEHYTTLIVDSNNNTDVDTNLKINSTDIITSGGSDLAHTTSTTPNYDHKQLLQNTAKENLVEDDYQYSLTTESYKKKLELIAESNTMNVKLKLSQNKSDVIETEKSDFANIMTTTPYYEKHLLQNTTQGYFPDNHITESIVGESNNSISVDSKRANNNTDILKSEKTDSAHTMSITPNYVGKQLLENATKENSSDDNNLNSLTTKSSKNVGETLIADNTVNVDSKHEKNSTDNMKPEEIDLAHTVSTISNFDGKQFLQNTTQENFSDDNNLKSFTTENYKIVSETLIAENNDTINISSKIQKTLNYDSKQFSQNASKEYLPQDDAVTLMSDKNNTINVDSKISKNETDILKSGESLTISNNDSKQVLQNTTIGLLLRDGFNSLTTDNYGYISEITAGSNNTINNVQSKPTNNSSTLVYGKNDSATVSIPLNYDDKKLIQNFTIDLSDDELLSSLTTENYKNVSEALTEDRNNAFNVESNLQTNHTYKTETGGNLENITQEYLSEPLELKNNRSNFEETTSLVNDTLQVEYPIILTTEQIKINYDTENMIDELSSTKSYGPNFSLTRSTTENVLVTTTNIDLLYSTELSKNQLNNTKIISDWGNSPFSILGPQTTSDDSINSNDKLPMTNNIISTTKSYYGKELSQQIEKTTIPISQLNVDKYNGVFEQTITNGAINENTDKSNNYEKVNSSFDKNKNVDKNETYIYTRENYLISSDDYLHDTTLEPTIEKYKQEEVISVTPDSQLTSTERDIMNSASISSTTITSTNILKLKDNEYMSPTVHEPTISSTEDNLTSYLPPPTTTRDSSSYGTEFENHLSNSNITLYPIAVGNILPANNANYETTTLPMQENEPHNVNSTSKYFFPRTTLITNEPTSLTTPIAKTTNRIDITKTITKTTSPSTLETKEHLNKVIPFPNNVTKSFDEKAPYNKMVTTKLIEEMPLVIINENNKYNDSITDSMNYFATTKEDNLFIPDLNTSTERATGIDSKTAPQKPNKEANTLSTFNPVSEKSSVYNTGLKTINNEEETIPQNINHNISHATTSKAKNSTVLINEVRGESYNKSNLILFESSFSQQLIKDETTDIKHPTQFISTNKTNSSFFEPNKTLNANVINTTYGGLINSQSHENNNFNDSFNDNHGKINNTEENLNTTSVPLISLNSTQIKINNKTQTLSLNTLSNEQSNLKVYVNTQNTYCQNQPAGKYAHKNDCKKFYVCSSEVQSFIGECPNGTVFSESKKQCIRNLSECYENSQFKCLSSGRYNDLRIKNVYYICLKNKGKFLKFKYQCQSGYSLNKTIVQCVQDSPNVSTATSEDLSNTKEESTSISLESSSKISEEGEIKEIKNKSEDNDKEFECIMEGKFPHPKECNKYYTCSKTKKSEFRRRLKSCDSNEVFDMERHTCVDGDSSEC